jgi:hypothetical protein
MHTVIAADGAGQPLRVACGYCRSEHNYRGGPRIGVDADAAAATPVPVLSGVARSVAEEPRRAASLDSRGGFDPVSQRERSAPPIMIAEQTNDLELLLRRIIREETGLTAVAPAEKWRGGTLALRPGNAALQEKTCPIETFFHKVVMLRNRLRTLEQQINASDLPDDAKLKLQGYVSGCYGSLTSFNVLFANDDDQFKGSGAD